MNDASSETRNDTRFATSSGCPMRPSVHRFYTGGFKCKRISPRLKSAPPGMINGRRHTATHRILESSPRPSVRDEVVLVQPVHYHNNNNEHSADSVDNLKGVGSLTERGVDRAGGVRVHGDPVLAVVQRGALRHPAHRELCRAVDSVLRVACGVVCQKQNNV